MAKADLFPRLTLSGFIGFVAGDADELGESTSRAWSLSPVLSWAGFERGTYARVLVAEARPQAALACLRARRACARSRKPRTRSPRTVRTGNGSGPSSSKRGASRRAAELARIQYREGALDFLRLLDAERTLLQAEDEVAAAETNLNSSVVQIYKALGGGWEAAPVPAI